MADQLSLPFEHGRLPRWAKPLRRKLGRKKDRCLWCGQRPVLEVFEYWPSDRSFMFETCCEPSYQWYLDEMTRWTPQEWQAFFASSAGVPIRGVGGDVARREELGIHPDEIFTVDAGITLVRSQSVRERLAGRSRPGALARDEIREYVRRVHSHAPDPPAGFLWGYSVFNGMSTDPLYDGKPRFTAKAKGSRPQNLVRWPDALIGVVMVGRPGAIASDKGAKKKGIRIAEVTRVALNHGLPSFLTYKASSMIYDQAYRDACAQGYTKAQTFTLESESGMSLRYARWKPVGTTKGGQADRPSRRRKARTAELAQPKVKWERVCR